jgi:hypothetical protein
MNTAISLPTTSQVERKAALEEIDEQAVVHGR